MSNVPPNDKPLANQTRRNLLLLVAFILGIIVVIQLFSSTSGTNTKPGANGPSYEDFTAIVAGKAANQTHSAATSQATFQLLSGKSNPIEAAVTRLDAGDLNGAIAIVDRLCRQNPTNEQIANLRIQMGLLRLRLAESEKTNTLQRTRLRKHVTQLPQIDQLTWAVIEQKAGELSGKAGTNVPKKNVGTLLNDVKEFLTTQPDFLSGWLLQARLALLLNSAADGFAAAFNLDQLGAHETNRPDILKTLQQLDERGWWLRTNSKQP